MKTARIVGCGAVALLVFVLALGGTGRAAGGAAPTDSPAGKPTAPRILVVLVVDQMAAWMADERWNALPPEGGFARLRREGLYARELHFSHVATDTAPGHTALFTGAVPHQSGILANEVVPLAGGDPVSVLADPDTHVIAAGVAGPGAKTSSSLKALRVETLADTLVDAHPDAQVISLSLKDRGALIAGGHHPAAAIWLDPELGTFVTSSAIASAFPEWAVRLADAAAVRGPMAAGWDLGDRAWVTAHAETGDDTNGESNYQGLGRTFPHPVGSPKALRATPAADGLLFALADAAAGQIAASGKPGLLSVSLSAHDYVVHLYGPHSWEAWDELAKLDRGLGEFLTRLDQLFGPAGYAVMLTGDHGSNALPELTRSSPGPWCRTGGAHPDHWQRSCGPRQRLIPKEVAAAVEAAVGKALGPERGPFIAGIADPMLFFTQRARALPAADRKLLVREATKLVKQTFGIREVVELQSTPETCPPVTDESLRALVCHSLRSEGPGDLYLEVPPGTFFDPHLAIGAGTSHGSPYLYDRAVPLLVRAPGRVRGGQVRTRPVLFTAFARTAASLLEVRAPAAAVKGEDLTRP